MHVHTSFSRGKQSLALVNTSTACFAALPFLSVPVIACQLR
jgi:hypothetical protein